MKYNKIKLISFLLLGLGFFLLILAIYFAIFLVGVPYSQNTIKLVRYNGQYFYKNIGYNIVDFLLSPTQNQTIWVKSHDNKLNLRCVSVNIPILNLSGLCMWTQNNFIEEDFRQIFNKTNQEIYGILIKEKGRINYKIQK